MIIKEATQVGNRIIRAKSKDVSNPASKINLKITKDLIDSMRHHGLVGMAAPQMGKNVRIFVTEIKKTKFRKKRSIDPVRVFINPRILSFSKKKQKDWEGCGSVAQAGLFGLVNRPYGLTVRAFDRKGKRFVLKAKGLLARIIQHEMDHLNGIVFTDKGDPKTYMSRNEYLKLRTRKK